VQQLSVFSAYLMTSSAPASSVAGTSMPYVLAVWSLVGCMTGGVSGLLALENAAKRSTSRSAVSAINET
jgi:hypothetical protein